MSSIEADDPIKSFHASLKGLGIPKSTARGCALAKRVHECPPSILFKSEVFELDEETDTEENFRFAHEYVCATRDQLQHLSLGKAPNRRWHDFLRPEDLLKRATENRVGFDLYRAVQKSAVRPSEKRFTRNDNPPDFWDHVDRVKEIQSHFRENRVMTSEEIAGWAHDLRSMMTVLHQVEILNYIPVAIPSMERLLIAGQMTKCLNFSNANDFIQFIQHSFLPTWDRFIEQLKTDPFIATDEDRALADSILQAYSLMKQMLSDFQNSYEGFGKRFRFLKLSDYLDQAAAYLHNLSRETFLEISNRCPDDFSLWANPTDILRIFENLIKNACEAMDSTGRQKHLEILVGLTSSDDAAEKFKNLPFNPIKAFCQEPNSQIVHIRFQDNGCGIPSEKHRSLFSKTTSTKPGGQGVGLLNVRKLVHAYGGHIELEPSNLGMGACFSILLPVFRDRRDCPHSANDK